MRNAWRAFRATLEAGLAADRGLTIRTFTLATLAWAGIPLSGLSVKALADAVVAHDTTAAFVASVVMAVLWGGWNLLQRAEQAARLTLQEKTAHELEQRLIRLAGDLPGIEHLERPEYLDRLATLRAQSIWFGNIIPVLELPAVALNVGLAAVLLASLEPILILLPIAVVPAIYLNGRAETAMRGAEAAIAPVRRLRQRLFTLTTDDDAAKEFRVFGLGPDLLRRHGTADHAYRGRLDRADLRSIDLSIAGWAIYGVAFGAAFALLADRVLAGTRTIGDVFLLFYLARGLSWQTGHMLYRISNVRRTLTATQHYLWLTDYAANDRAARPAPTAPAPAGGLQFEDVSFTYPGSTRRVLDGVSFEAPPGSTVAIVGDNGAGKTTLVKLIARFYVPDAGRITVGGVDLREVPVGEWRDRLAACFQDFAQFEFVVRETVGVGALDSLEDLRIVEGAIDAAGAGDVTGALAQGLETQLGSTWDEGADLSIGQWQKLALARALMRPSPAILLLDEPTASLDARTEAALFARFTAASAYARERRGVTLIVSHRMSTVRMADRILVLADGRVVEFGTHDELLAARGLYAELYGIQRAAYLVE